MDKNNNSKRWALVPVILALAWPTMLEHLMQTAVQYIDTAMVGSLGTYATAAVGSTGAVNFLIVGTIMAIGVGFLAYVAQSIGKGRADMAKRAAGQAVMCVVSLGFFFTFVALAVSSKVPAWMHVSPEIQGVTAKYFFIVNVPLLFRVANMVFGMLLRASGDTKTPMKAGIAMNLTNMCMNYLLIYETRYISLFGLRIFMPGAGMGVVGAATATALSYVVGGVVLTIKLWTHPVISPKGQRFTPDGEILKPCLKIAVPNMLQRFATTLGFVFFGSMINSLGTASTAAHTIANTVESAFYIPGWGLNAASATLSGKAFGAKDDEQLNKIVKTALPMSFTFMIFSGSLLLIFAPQLVGFFSKDPQVIALGSTVLRMVAVSEPFYGINQVSEGIMQGLGNTIPPFIINVAGIWSIRILGTYILTQIMGYGLTAAWACMIAHNCTMCFIFATLFLTNHWKPKKARI